MREIRRCNHCMQLYFPSKEHPLICDQCWNKYYKDRAKNLSNIERLEKIRNLYYCLRNIETRIIPRGWDKKCEWSKYIEKEGFPNKELKSEIIEVMKSLLNHSNIIVKNSAKRILDILRIFDDSNSCEKI